MIGGKGVDCLGICCTCFCPITDEAFQFREGGRKFHPECARDKSNYYVKLEMELAEKEREEKEKAAKAEGRTCPRCKKPMEEFAAAWGWTHCYECSVELRRMATPLKCSETDCMHNRQAKDLQSICAYYAGFPGADETGKCKYFVAMSRRCSDGY